MSKKTEKAGELALLKDVAVPDVLQVLDQKLKDLKFITESTYKTSGNLEGFGDIKKETLIPNLIRAASMVISKRDFYENAAVALELSTYPAFEIGGFSVENWLEDIKLRKAIIEQKDTHDKLVEFKNKMSKFLSEEDQKEILFREMQDFLGKN